MFVAAFAVPYILVVIAIFVVFSVWLFNYSMKAYTESYRIESVINSPLLSHFQETFNGNSVIRAFSKQKEFKDKNLELVNKTTLTN